MFMYGWNTSRQRANQTDFSRNECIRNATVFFPYLLSWKPGSLIHPTQSCCVSRFQSSKCWPALLLLLHLPHPIPSLVSVLLSANLQCCCCHTLLTLNIWLHLRELRVDHKQLCGLPWAHRHGSYRESFSLPMSAQMSFRPCCLLW